MIEDASRITVITRLGDELAARAVSADPANDVALLKVDATVEPVPVDASTAVAVGDDVFTLGYPLPVLEGTAQKATFGHVNALSGVHDDIRFFQIDVPVQPGNSGGPLFGSNGKVIGMVSSVLSPEKTLQVAGTLPQNVNYAVKSEYVLPLLAHEEITVRMSSTFGQLKRTDPHKAPAKFNSSHRSPLNAWGSKEYRDDPPPRRCARPGRVVSDGAG